MICLSTDNFNHSKCRAHEWAKRAFKKVAIENLKQSDCKGQSATGGAREHKRGAKY